jgi:Uma2 family endonuclease
MSTVPVPRRREAAAPSPALRPAACTVLYLDRQIVVPPSAHTLAGFRAWATSPDFPDRGRISFIDHEIIIDMSPEEIETHNKVKTEVGFVLANLNKRLKLGEFYSDRSLVTNVEANVSNEPDAAFALWETLEQQRLRLVPKDGKEDKYMELEGTPDWVLEIVSDSSVRKDTRRLRERYHRAGIPEYWLIDARRDNLDFQLLVRGETDYTAAAGRGGWQASPVFRRRFRLVRQRGRMDLWEYTLQVKPLR